MKGEEAKLLLTGPQKQGYGTGQSEYAAPDSSTAYYGTSYNTLVEDDVRIGCWPCKRRNKALVQNVDVSVPDDHCHRPRVQGPNRKATRQLLIATGLCFLFMVTEAVGGYLSNSIAVLTDAAHLCTDLFAFFVSLASLALAARKPSPTMTFGWKKSEVVGAIISVLLIWVITAILVDLAVDRLLNPNYKIDAPIMVGTSVVGIIVNIIMGCALNQDSAGGDVNINVRAAFIHVLGDLVQSVGVFSASIIIFVRPDWIIADPICTFIFSVIVLCTTFGVLKDAIGVLVAACPPGLDAAEVATALLALPGVEDLHDLRIWALSMDSNVVMVHLAVRDPRDCSSAVELATNLLRQTFRFHEICVQVEPYKNGMKQCAICNENKMCSKLTLA